MRILIYLFALAQIVLTACSAKQASFEVISFNIRLDHAGNDNPQWKHRIPLVKEYLQEKKPGIIGMQEVLPNQLGNLKTRLTSYIGEITYNAFDPEYEETPIDFILINDALM